VTAVLHLTSLGSATPAASSGGGLAGAQPTLLVLLVLAATAVGLAMRRRDGRFRAAAGVERVDPEEIGHPLGTRRTFLQVSAATCATCPQVARVLGAVADATDGVAHVEIRVEEHDALVRRLGVLRTPTVLLLDADGVVLSRTSGPLRPEQARAALVADELHPVSAVR
jgi:thiol-disulfide isomerase/thioredoxin